MLRMTTGYHSLSVCGIQQDYARLCSQSDQLEEYYLSSDTLTAGRAQRRKHQATQGTDNVHRMAEITRAAKPMVQAKPSLWRPASKVFHS